jgi:hypothetical protein
LHSLPWRFLHDVPLVLPCRQVAPAKYLRLVVGHH